MAAAGHPKPEFNSQSLFDSVAYPALRVSPKYPHVKEFWDEVRRIGMQVDDSPPFSNCQVRPLIEAAYDYALACTWIKNSRAASARASSKQRKQQGEHDRRLKLVKRRLADRVHYLRHILIADYRQHGYLKQTSEEQTKRRIRNRASRGMEPGSPLPVLPLQLLSYRWLKRILDQLRLLEKGFTQLSQPKVRVRFRRQALARMVATNKAATGKPCWDLIKLAVYLASGGELDFEADVYKREYRSYLASSR
jgi:hypothetical protein